MRQGEERKLAIRFFRLLKQKNFAQAERILDEASHRARGSEWRRGYIHALRGMLIASRSGADRYAFISRIGDRDLKSAEIEFERMSRLREPLQTSFDRGIFTAWADYIVFLGKGRSNWEDGGRPSGPAQGESKV